ncbi:hypothetical protein CEXT_158451 [Caerostris extrusa]|uniref:Uncharacterized protein n=1 Tax=Caerostris extrusa TaxID=172846 RepID=A0AAV4X0X1_CAEEX|nr:hypothetical protein CEXT_158451 [Caerostris extrusa]
MVSPPCEYARGSEEHACNRICDGRYCTRIPFPVLAVTVPFHALPHVSGVGGVEASQDGIPIVGRGAVRSSVHIQSDSQQSIRQSGSTQESFRALFHRGAGSSHCWPPQLPRRRG